MRIALSLLLLFAGAAAAAEPKLAPLHLTYAATWKGMGLGEIVITLKPAAEPDCYRYESLSNPVGLVRMFYGRPREISEFCIRGGRVVARRFEFDNPKHADRSFTLEFDPAAGTVRDGRGVVREVPANAQDRFALQQAVRLWVLEQVGKDGAGASVEFTMVDDRRVKAYRFAITGRDEIEVPAGRFETVLVQRVDDPKKSTRFWLAPSSDYMPIKVEQIKGGNTDLRMVLKARG